MCSATLVPTFSRTLRRCVLAWLLLAMAAAWATPLIQHGRLDLVCSGSGQMRLVQLGDDEGTAGQAGSPSGLDCPNCLLLGPLPGPCLWQPALPLAGAGLAASTRPSAPHTFQAAPPPARGPPSPRFH
ncbi:MAG: hypothetical protein CFE41_09890 [Burkholderiales bacterium PBB2]|nr:MAG: hypothetical protein CFE41_09890 [Burkholderiales bacterium PBB2]